MKYEEFAYTIMLILTKLELETRRALKEKGRVRYTIGDKYRLIIEKKDDFDDDFEENIDGNNDNNSNTNNNWNIIANNDRQ